MTDVNNEPEGSAMHSDNEKSAVACTLSAAEHQQRLGRIHELNAAALRDYRRAGEQITLTYHAWAGAQVREFVRRERECCKFLHFTIREERDMVLVVIGAPNVADEAADALFAPHAEPRASDEPRPEQ